MPTQHNRRAKHVTPLVETIANIISDVVGGAVRRLRRGWLRMRGARIAKHCWIQRIELPRNPWDVELQEHVALDRDVVLLSTGPRRDRPRILLGRGCYINRFTMIDACEQIDVCENAMIGPFCYITDHDHGHNVNSPINQQPLQSRPVHIGRDAWLGAHVTVLKGVTIGDGAIIGAGAVVTNDVPPNAVVAGVPARAIAWR